MSARSVILTHSITVTVYPANPLTQGMLRVQHRVDRYSRAARNYYFLLALLPHRCPACGARLHMTGPSKCACAHGHTFDPTIAFQRSPCCNKPLRRRQCHYACTHCGSVIPSRFLFDERLFDPTYFAQKMRETRQRARDRREAIRQLLAGTRSQDLVPVAIPDLEDVPGLVTSLDVFVGSETPIDLSAFTEHAPFRMNVYRDHILELLERRTTTFSNIPALNTDPRRDKARRFTTLIYMEHEHEVCLAQYGNDLLVSKYEADA